MLKVQGATARLNTPPVLGTGSAEGNLPLAVKIGREAYDAPLNWIHRQNEGDE